MQQSLEADILATRKSLASESAALVRLKGQFPLDAQAIVDRQVRIESLQDGLKRLNDLKTELF